MPAPERFGSGNLASRLSPRRRPRVAALLWVAIAVTLPAPARAANGTIPGELTACSTLVCAGFEWRVSGDDNRDCTVALEYRLAGATAWQPAQPLWRVHSGLWTHGEDPGNLLAGSLFGLAPSTPYEARLSLADPDGGVEQRVIAFATRAEARSSDERVLRVFPGTGGGTGTIADPFRGLVAAASTRST